MRKRVLGQSLIGSSGWLCFALALVIGCKSQGDAEQSVANAQDQAATISSAPIVDSKIAKAVANAAKAAPTPEASDQGPPENGILGAARANAELPIGGAPKLKLGAAGSEPRLQLGSTSGFDKKSGQLDVSLRTGASMLPSTALKLDLSQSAPTAPSAAEGSATTTTLAGLPVVVSVTQSELSPTQPAQIPAELGDEIRKLKGSQLTFQTREASLVGAPALSLAKGANPQLDTLVLAAATGLSDAALPYPTEPVGVGAFWMVTSRESLLGTDVVAYRMVKVVDITDGAARLEVNTKRYLGDGGIGLPGIESARVHQFQAESSAQFVIAAKQTLPTEGRSQTAIRSLAEIEGAPRPIQIELRTEFAFK